jgi:hexosaminidase
MSWRGTEGGLAAVNSGHKAIMTPGGYCYLDSYQDAPHTQPMAFGPYMPLEKVYSYNPTEGLEGDKAKLIYGIQGNLWAEYIPTEEMIEYMAYPRILAIAEIGWSNPGKERNYAEFKTRTINAVEWLHSKGYNAFDLKNEYGQREEAREPITHLAVGGKATYSTAAPYNERYCAAGDNSLIDGIRGGWTYTDSKWQGFIRDGVDVVIDLGEEKEINSIAADFMQMCIPDVWFPAEVVIEVAGAENTFELAWKCARPSAIVTVVALYDKAQTLPLPNMYGKNLTFKTGGVDGCDCEETLKLIAEGKLDTEPLITHTFPLSKIDEAYELFENKRDGVIKIAVEC